MQQKKERLSFEDCFAYLEENLFNLTSAKNQETFPLSPGRVGLEIEMLSTMPAKDGSPPFPKNSQESALIFQALKQLGNKFSWEIIEEKYESSPNALIMMKLKDGENLSFEPGGQVEFSSQPYICLDTADRRLREIQKLLDSVLNPLGAYLVQAGVNPWYSPEEIGLQTPKKRYLAMDKYFTSLPSSTGRRMMRQTCSIQVCLDFGYTEQSLVKRYLAAQVLGPIASAIFANSPFIDRQLSDCLSKRVEIWQGLDSKRTGFTDLESISRKMTRNACIETYLQYALACPVVFVTDLDYQVPSPSITMKEWMEKGFHGTYPGLQDFITHLTLLFPEVRPRGYMELRGIDCQARAWQIVPAAFYTGLLYDEKNLEFLMQNMKVLLAQLPQNMALAKHGLTSPQLGDHAKKMMGLAIEGLGRLPKNYCAKSINKVLTTFYHRFTEQSRTPAQEIIELNRKSGQAYPTINDYFALEDKWQSLTD